MLSKNIIITGFMGTGKSTVGKSLAFILKKQFLDMDSLIEEKEGKSITDIFQLKGENYFRNLEKNILKEIIMGENMVIATGGGALLEEDNFILANKEGLVVLLKATPTVIFSRLKKDKNRPLLSGDDKLRKIIDLMEKRKEKYDRFANSIDTSDFTVEQIVGEIIKIYRRKYNE
ncbi:MAG: shikimate kinase [Atribacterota bacterium]|nr:shikimate kinase [Atribacterota bacterium]